MSNVLQDCMRESLRQFGALDSDRQAAKDCQRTGIESCRSSSQRQRKRRNPCQRTSRANQRALLMTTQLQSTYATSSHPPQRRACLEVLWDRLVSGTRSSAPMRKTVSAVCCCVLIFSFAATDAVNLLSPHNYKCSPVPCRCLPGGMFPHAGTERGL